MTPRPRLPAASAMVVVVSTALTTTPANAASGVVVGGSTPATASQVLVNGNALDLGRSTRADVQKVEKRRPDGVFTLSGRFGAGTVLVYAVSGGCWRQYTIPVGSSRIGDFETTCRDARTFDGVRPGMTTAAAASASGKDWTPAQYGSHLCPLAGSVLSLTAKAPYLSAISDSSSARVASIGLFAGDPVLAQVARCGSSPF